MTIWFTSDLHFGHKNIIQYENRPFATVEEMNEKMIDSWNRGVKDDDKVFILGDFAMGKIKETLPIALQLRGQKFLVPGNHDRCWVGHFPDKSQAKEWGDWCRRYEDVGLHVLPAVGYSLQLHDQTVEMCHFPYKGESGNKQIDRYPGPPDNGNVLLHGHVHGAWRKKGRQINVGIDAWGGDLVSINAIDITMRDIDVDRAQYMWPPKYREAD